ncbi:MAG: deoxyribonuclease IV [bacterium]
MKCGICNYSEVKKTTTTVDESNMKFGLHIGISGPLINVVERAVFFGCDTLQIFTRNPRSWGSPKDYSEEDISAFKKGLKKNRLEPLVIHISYLPNFASPNPDLIEKSVNMLISDLNWAEKLSASYLVIHPGKHMGSGIAPGIQRIIESIDIAFSSVKNKVQLLLENTAGQGTEIGTKLEELKAIMDGCEQSERIGVCLDLCHLYVAGYDLRDRLDETLEVVDNIIGLSRVKILHGSDCKAECGSHLDRHEHIGEGKIGLRGFERVANHPLLTKLPLILETPKKEEEDDLRNIARIRSLVKKRRSYTQTN